MQPLALELYERYRAGESIRQIASELGIAETRVEARIRAAEAYWAQRKHRAA